MTGRAEDAFRFRTPSLRNVAQTAPYGHAGAEPDLRRFVAMHLRPGQTVAGFDGSRAVLPPLAGAEDWRVMTDAAGRDAIAAAAEPRGPPLGKAEIDALLAFLHALTDERALAGRLGIPAAVPSGLDVPQ